MASHRPQVKSKPAPGRGEVRAGLQLKPHCYSDVALLFFRLGGGKLAKLSLASLPTSLGHFGDAAACLSWPDPTLDIGQGPRTASWILVVREECHCIYVGGLEDNPNVCVQALISDTHLPWRRLPCFCKLIQMGPLR